MHAYGLVEQRPLPFEQSWTAPVTTRAALAFLRGLLLSSGGCAPVDRLLATRWRDARAALFAPRDGEAAGSVRLASTSECEPTVDDPLNEPQTEKLRTYAEQHAEGLATIAASIRPTLLADQIERIAHWATGGTAIATHALLVRLAQCCERVQMAEVRANGSIVRQRCDRDS